jgi:cell division septation protein DedD
VTKNILVALGLVVVVILGGFYFFFSGSPPLKGPEKLAAPEVKPPAVSEPLEKVAEMPAPAPASTPAAPPTPAPQDSAPPLPAPPRPPGEKPVAKPEPAPAPQETALPPLEPQEGFGLLAGSYRKYEDASNMLEKLKKEGQPGIIRKEKGKYQVWVGPFSSTKEADAAAKALKGKVKISSKVYKMVTPVPK